MIILAISPKDKHFIYDATTARKVSKKSADTILKIVNEYEFLLSCHPGCEWYKYEVNEYDSGYHYAQFQSFTIRNGIVTARNF